MLINVCNSLLYSYFQYSIFTVLKCEGGTCLQLVAEYLQESARKELAGVICRSRSEKNKWSEVGRKSLALPENSESLLSNYAHKLF